MLNGVPAFDLRNRYATGTKYNKNQKIKKGKNGHLRNMNLPLSPGRSIQSKIIAIT